MRLIDADLLKIEICKWLNPAESIEEPRMVDADDVAVSVMMTIDEQPTIENILKWKNVIP